MKSLLDKAIETKELNGELILHSQAILRGCDNVLSMTVSDCKVPTRLKILRNTYTSYLRTVK